MLKGPISVSGSSTWPLGSCQLGLILWRAGKGPSSPLLSSPLLSSPPLSPHPPPLSPSLSLSLSSSLPPSLSLSGCKVVSSVDDCMCETVNVFVHLRDTLTQSNI